MAEDKSEEIAVTKNEGTGAKAKGIGDPVVPIAIILAIFVLLSTILYYMLPLWSVDSFDMTLAEFQETYKTTDMNAIMLEQRTNGLPTGFKYVNAESLKKVWGIEEETDSSKNDNKPELANNKSGRIGICDYTFYENNFAAEAELKNVLFEGTERKTDKKLTRLVTYVTYDEQHYSMMVIFNAGIIETFDPSKTSAEAIGAAYKMSNTLSANGEKFIVDGKVAYRMFGKVINDKSYVGAEFVPASSLDSSMIMETEETKETEESKESETAKESSESSTAN